MKQNVIEIWQPKYKDDTALVATYKVTPGDNIIVFTRAPHLADMKFKVSGDEIKKHPVVSNGKIDCYAVPMGKLERVE